MDTVMIPDIATELTRKLLAAWRTVLDTIDQHDSHERGDIIRATLDSIMTLVAEHYDFRRPSGSDTTVGFNTMRMYAEPQVRILEDLAVQLVLSCGPGTPEPKAAEYRRIFICTAVAAGQLKQRPTAHVVGGQALVPYIVAEA